MISRSHVIGLGLAVGLMLAGGTGFAVADSTPRPAAPMPAPALCKIATGSGAPTVVTVVPGTGAKCVPFVRGAIPKGAPGTGGGGMAVEVGSWH